MIEEFHIPDNSTFSDILIPTIDTVQQNFLLESIIVHEYHLLFTGNTGTGKSSLIRKFIKTKLSVNEFTSGTLMFGVTSNCIKTQEAIDSKLKKRKKGVYGPEYGKKLVIFVDDLNIPKKEETGA